jgi:hypothetical protein
MFPKYISYTLILILLFLATSGAQVPGPVIPVRVFEIGVVQKTFHRDMIDQDYDWNIISLFVRYGICSSITISAESFIHDKDDKKFPDRDYYDYVFGIGITAGGVSFKGVCPALSVHYNERLSFDRSEFRYHKNTRGIIGAIQLEREFNMWNQNIRIWLGPAFVYDIIYQYPTNGSIVLCKSKNNFGFICGTNILFIKHFDCFAHVVYANYWQPRFGIGFRF